jgi:uncharacterized protein with PQ loop repeat
MMADWIGWLATVVFVTSYLSKSSITLRRIQGLAACLWALYGVLIHAKPVIVANVMVAAAAVASSVRRARREPTSPVSSTTVT